MATEPSFWVSELTQPAAAVALSAPYAVPPDRVAAGLLTPDATPGTGVAAADGTLASEVVVALRASATSDRAWAASAAVV